MPLSSVLIRHKPLHLAKWFSSVPSKYTPYPIDTLLSELARRITHLEYQVEQLTYTQQRLQTLQTVLKMNETFRALHRHLAQLLENPREGLLQDQRIRRVLSKYRLTAEDIQRTLELSKTRNEMAHPSGEPDLTEVDCDLIRIYAKVQLFLQDRKRP